MFNNIFPTPVPAYSYFELKNTWKLTNLEGNELAGMKSITQSVRSEATWYISTNVCRDGLGAEFKSPSIIQGHISRTPQAQCSSFVVYPPLPWTHTTLTRSKYGKCEWNVEEKCLVYYLCAPSTIVNFIGFHMHRYRVVCMSVLMLLTMPFTEYIHQYLLLTTITIVNDGQSVQVDVCTDR